MSFLATTTVTKTQTCYRACLHTCVCCNRSVHADIRVRLDGVEDEHGIVRVAKDGKVGSTTLGVYLLFFSFRST